MSKFKLGFIINPIAGVGGGVALKGSDNMVAQALALGAVPKANERAKIALEVLLPYKEDIRVYSAQGLMGEEAAKSLGFQVEVIYQTKNSASNKQDNSQLNSQLSNEGNKFSLQDKYLIETSEDDTKALVLALLEQNVDIILFAGGDGTARDIADTLLDYQADGSQVNIPVLGIPAGCKIHSGVYAVTPKAAGLVVELMVTKQLVTLSSGDVMDINESLFREGIVKAKRYGEMLIPSELRYVQAVKSGGKELDEFVLQDIAAFVTEQIQEDEDNLFIIGSGSTTAYVMTELGLEHTLLGVDLVKEEELIAKDVTEAALFSFIETQLNAHKNVKLVITLIGGQGHIFGRGNQQLSPRVIKAVISQSGGKDNIIIISTKTKLLALNQKPLICDTGDSELNNALSGFMSVTTGYNDKVLYAVSGEI
jgi:predicted polyphosphate/ATP-dependent NAD kinase